MGLAQWFVGVDDLTGSGRRANGVEKLVFEMCLPRRSAASWELKGLQRLGDEFSAPQNIALFRLFGCERGGLGRRFWLQHRKVLAGRWGV